MAAIKVISIGRQLDDFASVPSDYGREFKIRDALIDGEGDGSGVIRRRAVALSPGSVRRAKTFPTLAAER